MRPILHICIATCSPDPILTAKTCAAAPFLCPMPATPSLRDMFQWDGGTPGRGRCRCWPGFCTWQVEVPSSGHRPGRPWASAWAGGRAEPVAGRAGLRGGLQRPAKQGVPAGHARAACPAWGSRTASPTLRPTPPLIAPVRGRRLHEVVVFMRACSAPWASATGRPQALRSACAAAGQGAALRRRNPLPGRACIASCGNAFVAWDQVTGATWTGLVTHRGPVPRTLRRLDARTTGLWANLGRSEGQRDLGRVAPRKRLDAFWCPLVPDPPGTPCFTDGGPQGG